MVSVGAKAQRCNYIFEEVHVSSNIYQVATEATPSIPNTYKYTFTEVQPQPRVSDACTSISGGAVFGSTPAFQEPETSMSLKGKGSTQIQTHIEQEGKKKAFQQCCLINRGDRSRLALLS